MNLTDMKHFFMLTTIHNFKGTVMQIEKALINNGLRVRTYPEKVAFQLYIILQ